MDDDIRIAAQQLARMRGMTNYYHRRFFGDIRFTLVLGLAIVVVAVAIDERLIALLAPVALLGAAQTSFDASYLTFARQYARALEGWLNRRLDTDVLVGSQLEETYLYPLDKSKAVTLPFDRTPTWFGTITILQTVVGAIFYGLGMWWTWQAFEGGREARLYVAVLGVITVAVLALGIRWFVAGVGERKLREVLDPVFGEPA